MKRKPKNWKGLKEKVKQDWRTQKKAGAIWKKENSIAVKVNNIISIAGGLQLFFIAVWALNTKYAWFAAPPIPHNLQIGIFVFGAVMLFQAAAAQDITLAGIKARMER